MGKLQDAWKKAKRDFETSTGQKKPSEKLCLFFRKGTGIEASLKTLDATPSKSSYDQFRKSRDAYKKILDEEIKAANTEAKVKDACRLLLKALVTLSQDAEEAIDEASGIERRDFELRYDLSDKAQADSLTIARLPLSVHVAATLALKAPPGNPAKNAIDRFVETAKGSIKTLVLKYDGLIQSAPEAERRALLEKVNQAVGRINETLERDLTCNPNEGVDLCGGRKEVLAAEIWCDTSSLPKVFLGKNWTVSGEEGSEAKSKQNFSFDLTREVKATAITIPKMGLNLSVELETTSGSHGDAARLLKGEIHRWIGIYKKQLQEAIALADRDITKLPEPKQPARVEELRTKIVVFRSFLQDSPGWKSKLESFLEASEIAGSILSVAGKLEMTGAFDINQAWANL